MACVEREAGGPVWIDIPLDVQASPLSEPDSLRGFDPGSPAEQAHQVKGSDVPAEVAKFIERFNSSERPLLFAGNGIRLARAEG